jgi:hypothetical protein
MAESYEPKRQVELEKVPPGSERESLRLAERFLLQCVKGGLAHSLNAETGEWSKPYPEVTGYLLSYFSEEQHGRGIPGVIINAAKKLIRLQHRSGGYPSFYDQWLLFTFDSAQILHGLASLYSVTKEDRLLGAAIRAADFICAMQLPDGSMFPVYDLRREARYVEIHQNWGMRFSPIQAKNIEGLLLLNKLTGNARYARAAEGLTAFGKRAADTTYTHPGGYCLEGLLAAGETRFVSARLRSDFLPRLQPNGFLPYSPGLPYAYVSGSIQIGILFYKVGLLDESHKILEWARRVQRGHPSGGLFQYADPEGRLDRHVHLEINSWGTKYFCQLERLFSCGQ